MLNIIIVFRAANEKIPLIGILVKALQPISVTREDSKNKLAVINEIKNRTNPDSIWPDQVCVFPEGTTTNRSCLITFKPGIKINIILFLFLFIYQFNYC